MPEGTQTPRTSLIEAAGKWIAVIGAIVTTGQAGTTWIHGYWQGRLEKQKAEQEIELAGIKEKSALAQQYLAIILDKNTKPSDQAVLLTALASIKGHPLQEWAQQRYRSYEENISRLYEAYKAQSDAAQKKESSEQQVSALTADIAAINSELNLARDDPERRQTLQRERIIKSSELAHVKATLSVADIRVEEATSAIDLSKNGLSSVATANKEIIVASISSKITVSFLSELFPDKSAQSNILAGAPFLQAALQEYKVADKRIVAAMVATIALETADFTILEEIQSGNAYDSRVDLGNTQRGDGSRFRARGYIGLIGRANYKMMSERLGLGTRLIDSPEDARSPEVASRILAAWFADREKTLTTILSADNLGAALRVVRGGTRGIVHFKEIYSRTISYL